MLPSATDVDGRLIRILARGSVNLGLRAGTERLMLMLTRSCELRCSYCFVAKTETGPRMPLQTALKAVDLLMRSERPKLELQLFGGEPTRAWDVLAATVDHALNHPRRLGRPLQIVLTTNGVGLSPDRIAFLAARPVTVLLSLDGDATTHRRFRPSLADDDGWGGTDEEAWSRIDAAIDALLAHEVAWFMNAVVPPSDAGSLPDRYAWARRRGVPALQLNYAVGMRWSEAQTERYLDGLVQVMRAHHADPGALVLYNWRSDAEPVMLSDDLIVDVDGTVLHDGAIFLERAFAELAATYDRGHLDHLDAFDPLRWSLARIYEVMVGTYPEGSGEREIIVHNIRLGAMVDLVIQRVTRDLGRAPSRGA